MGHPRPSGSGPDVDSLRMKASSSRLISPPLKGKEKNNQPELLEEKEPELKPGQKPIKSGPVASISILGTVWCLVQTNDGKHFFYDSSKRRSVWKMPEELKNNSDVEKLLSPKSEVKTEKLEEQSIQEGPPIKKIRSETEVKEKSTSEDDQTIVLENQIAVASEVQVAQQRSVVPVDARIQQFKELLTEKKVSAHSTWEKELHKIAFDKRYLLLSLRERKQTFEEYVKKDAEEKRLEIIRETKRKTDLYRQLLEESNLNAKSTFDHFAAEYSKNERFKVIDKMEDRISLFLEYISELVSLEKQEDTEVEEEVTSDDMVETEEQENSFRKAAAKDFKNFLAEKVENPTELFDVFKSKFSRHPRWRTELTDVEKMKLYESHIAKMYRKNREILWSIFTELDIQFTTEWSSIVQGAIAAHPQFASYIDYQNDLTLQFYLFVWEKERKARQEFQELLRETKIFTPITLTLLQEKRIKMDHIRSYLLKDKRYAALDCIDKLRQQLILAYINELKENAQPPLT